MRRRLRLALSGARIAIQLLDRQLWRAELHLDRPDLERRARDHHAMQSASVERSTTYFGPEVQA